MCCIVWPAEPEHETCLKKFRGQLSRAIEHDSGFDRNGGSFTIGRWSDRIGPHKPQTTNPPPEHLYSHLKTGRGILDVLLDEVDIQAKASALKAQPVAGYIRGLQSPQVVFARVQVHTIQLPVQKDLLSWLA